MAKELTVSIASSVSEAVKTAALKAANVPSGAANIVRDANGRVVEVRITLPDAAADAAAIALAATPGVANVASKDILPGTKGIDGTSLSGFTDLGFVETLRDILETLNDDGTITVQSNGLRSKLEEFSANSPIPFNNLGMSLEAKLKWISGVQNFPFHAECIDGAGSAAMTIELSGVDDSIIMVNAGSGNDQYGHIDVAGFDFSVFHVFKMVILPNAGGVQFFIDGVQKNVITPSGTLATLAYGAFAVPLAFTELDFVFGKGGVIAGIIVVDFIRWTAP